LNSNSAPSPILVSSYSERAVPFPSDLLLGLHLSTLAAGPSSAKLVGNPFHDHRQLPRFNLPMLSNIGARRSTRFPSPTTTCPFGSRSASNGVHVKSEWAGRFSSYHQYTCGGVVYVPPPKSRSHIHDYIPASDRLPSNLENWPTLILLCGFCLVMDVSSIGATMPNWHRFGRTQPSRTPWMHPLSQREKVQLEPHVKKGWG